MDKLGILVLRHNGLDYLHKVLNRIRTIESLTVKAILGIKWKEEECEGKIRDIYSNITDDVIIEKIMKIQGSVMIAIVLLDSKPDPLKMWCPKCGHKFTGERLDNMHINRIKDDFRSIYGNIIHSADTEKIAIEELQKFGVNLETINQLYSSKKTIVGKTFSHNDLIKNLNKIEDGVCIWYPR